jgi:hypothetical protein
MQISERQKPVHYKKSLIYQKEGELKKFEGVCPVNNLKSLLKWG